MRLENNTTIFVKDINEFRKVVSVLEQPLYNHLISPQFDEPEAYQFSNDELLSMYIDDVGDGDKIHWCNECYTCLNGCNQKDNKMIGFEEFISSIRQKKLNRII